MGLNTSSWSSGGKEKVALSTAVCSLLLAIWLQITSRHGAEQWPLVTTGNTAVCCLWVSPRSWKWSPHLYCTVTPCCPDLAPALLNRADAPLHWGVLFISPKASSEKKCLFIASGCGSLFINCQPAQNHQSSSFSFFQVCWDWKVIVPYLVVCSHNPFLSIWIPSLGASLWLTTWMKNPTRAFRKHSYCTFPCRGQPYRPPTPTQGAELRASWGLQESFCQLCRHLAKAHSDNKRSTLCRSSSSDGDGVEPTDTCKSSCWGEAGDGRLYLFAVGKKAFANK